MFHLLKFKDLSLYMHPLQATHPTKKETSSDPTKPHFSTPRGCSQSPINVASIDLAFHLDINASEEKRQETTVQAPFVSTQFLDDFFFGGGRTQASFLSLHTSPTCQNLTTIAFIKGFHCRQERQPESLGKGKFFCRPTWKRSQRCKPGADKRGRSRLSQLRMPNLCHRFLLLLLDSVEHLP